MPKYRGAAPVNFALLNGEQETGVTLMKMDKGLDTGPIINTKKLKIDINDTANYLLDKLSLISCELLKNSLFKYVDGELKPQQQDNEKASYAPLMKKEDGLIDFNKTKLEVHNQVRAFNPWPGTYTYLNGKKFKIVKTCFDSISYKLEIPGTVIKHGKKVYVACKDGYLNIEIIQPESKKAMDAMSCLNGGYLKLGECFGK